MSTSSAQIFADGSYKWNITCTDLAGNTAQGNAVIMNIDTAAPVLNFINQTGYYTTGNWSNTNSITFYINITENNYDNGTCTIYTNASTNSLLTNYSNVTLGYISNALSAAPAPWLRCRFSSLFGAPFRRDSVHGISLGVPDPALPPLRAGRPRRRLADLRAHSA